MPWLATNEARIRRSSETRSRHTSRSKPDVQIGSARFRDLPTFGSLVILLPNDPELLVTFLNTGCLLAYSITLSSAGTPRAGRRRFTVPWRPPTGRHGARRR